MRAATCTLYAMAATVLLAVASGFLFGHLTMLSAFTCLEGGVLVGAYAWWRERSTADEPWRIDPAGGLTLLVFALFALRSFLWLAFHTGHGLYVFSPNNLGDFSLHLTYIRQLAGGAPYWPENPIYAGAPLTYPLGADLLNSLLVLIGVDELRGLVWVGLIGSACTAAMLWRWGRGFAVAGFLFAGGAWGFDFFQRWQLLDYQADSGWPHDHVTVAWKSLPLALFVTQRGFLFALPAGLALLASWRARFLEPERSAQRLPLWGEWLLYTALPIFHLHSFLFLSIVAGVWFLAVPASRRHLGTVVALALVPATFLVWCVTGHFHGASVLGWQPGWMQEEQNFFIFWGVNFGFWVPLWIWLLVQIVLSRGPRSAALLAFPAVAIFVLCCFVKFAPWAWDNTKLMIWSHLLLLPAMWQVLVAAQPIWGRVPIFFLLFFSGFVSLLGGISGRSIFEIADGQPREDFGYIVASRPDLDGVRWATRDLGPTERFLGAPTFNHPLLLSGKVMVMGYDGHLWSHGIDYAARKALVERIGQGEEGWEEAVRQLGVRWIFWGELERNAWPSSARPWEGKCPVYASGAWGKLYDLQSLLR